VNVVLIVAAVGAISTAGAYLYGRHDGRELAAAQAAREERVAALAAESAASAAAVAIKGISVRNTTIRQEVRREIEQVPVLRDCVLPDGVRQRVDEALTGRPNTAAGGGLPAAQPAGR
jgi:hypothetical protein